MINCPLCLSTDSQPFFKKEDPNLGRREYFKCGECQLIFLSENLRLNRKEEKSRYDSHRNDSSDQRYIQFLSRLADPLSSKLQKGARGLDFGCGPSTTLEMILNNRGFQTKSYDPFYYPDQGLLEKTYDFVTCSEVVEHLHHPQEEFVRLDAMLKGNGGWLGVMTQVLEDEENFSSWWYHRDPTHVCFYQKETFLWIADWRNWRVEFPSSNVILASKL